MICRKTRGWLKILLLAGTWGLISPWAFGQVVPPGLGEVGTGSWLALGIKQDLDTLQKGGWESSTYIGFGRNGDVGGSHFLEKPGIFVLNQEFYHRFHPHWEYSLAASFRKQYLYDDETPYLAEDPEYKHEMRLYGRFSYIFQVAGVQITPTFRQEIIRYFSPGFGDFEEQLRYRSRFRMKFSVPLDQDQVHRLHFYSEQLFSISRRGEEEQWDTFGYKDSRFSVYYAWSPPEVPLTFHLGYMNNLIGRQNPESAHYLGVDMIWKNPLDFGR